MIKFFYKLLIGLKVCLSLLILFNNNLIAQPTNNIPSNQINSTATPLNLPNDFGSSILNGKKNYVRKFMVKYPENDASQINTNSSIVHVNESTDYYDGIGRNIQGVSKRGSNNTNDLVKTVIYDNLGKQTVDYLPYSSSSNIGKFKTTAFTELNNFYNSEFFPGMGTYVDDKIRYSQTIYDGSPLNRLTRTLAPGNGWGGSNKAVNYYYELNEDAELRLWKLDGNGLPVTTIEYAESEILKNIIKNEDDGIRVEYKDKNGLVVASAILEKWQLMGNVLKPVFLTTYNVYDDLNRLRYVIPPLAIQKLSKPINQGGLNWIPNQSLLDELCFQYRYDLRGRVIEKKLPGKGLETAIYDKLDRVILSQDENLKISNEWIFNIYDQLGRVKNTGLYVNASTRQVLQDYIDNLSSPPSSNSDMMHWLLDYNLPNSTYPTTVNDAEIHSYNYYDYYPSSISQVFNTQFTFPANQINADAVVPSNMTQGLLTYSRIKVLKPSGSNLSDWLTTINFYDSKGRLVQSQKDNQVGGIDITTIMYNFSGQIIAQHENHTNPNSIIDPAYNSTTIVKKFTYDSQNRLTHLDHNINNFGNMPLLNNTYDKLGRLRLKNLGANSETQTFTYNLRNFLTGINPQWVTTPLPSSINYFGEILRYESGFENKCYNGNIAGIIWRGADITKGQNAYGYTYDKANRLLHAEYRHNSIVNNQWDNIWIKNDIDFTNSDISYDANGNLLKMNHRGPGATGPVDMDVMEYTYKEVNGIPTNQLLAVKDLTTNNIVNNGSNHDFTDGTGAGLLNEDYLYDDNGNLISDANKLITAIQYNHLNKPERVLWSNNNTIQYIYDAVGNKLQKNVFETSSNTTTTTDYVNGHIYKTVKVGSNAPTSDLEYILHEEGRIRPFTNSSNNKVFTYDFFVKDHLGNVRATVNASPTIGIPSVTAGDHIVEIIGTLEDPNILTESIILDDLNGNIVNRPGGNSSNNRSIALDGDDPERRIGMSLLMQISPGDKWNIKTHGYYNSATAGEPINPSELVQNLITSFNNNSNVFLTGELTSDEIINTSLNNETFVNSWTAMINNNTNSTNPKAYLNYLFFDDNFELVPEYSGAIQINISNSWHELSTGTIPFVAKARGYLFVFHSVHSMEKVYFDDFDLTYYKGQLLEETHYYPFGLTMGMPMSTLSANSPENKYLYNTKELQRDEFGSGANKSGLELYDFGARLQDPQIGRWHCLDPKAHKYLGLTPYSYCDNNPVKFIDPDGKEIKNYYEDAKKYAGLEKALLDKIDNAKTKNEERIARQEWKKNLDNMSNYNDYVIVKELISAFKSKNESEFNRLNKLDFNGKEIDIVINLSHRPTDKNNHLGTTNFKYNMEIDSYNIVSDYGGNTRRVPTEILDNKLDVTLYGRGHTLNTLSNEFGDCIFAVERPDKNYYESVKEIPADEMTSHYYSDDYEEFIMNGGEKPNSDDY